MHPWMLDPQHLGHGTAGQHTLFRQNRDPVATAVQRIKVVRDQKNRQVQRVA